VKFLIKKNFIFIFIYFLGTSKREEIMDELNSSEQDLIAMNLIYKMIEKVYDEL
jgi:hypothetical protein